MAAKRQNRPIAEIRRGETKGGERFIQQNSRKKGRVLLGNHLSGKKRRKSRRYLKGGKNNDPV